MNGVGWVGREAEDSPFFRSTRKIMRRITTALAAKVTVAAIVTMTGAFHTTTLVEARWLELLEAEQ